MLTEQDINKMASEELANQFNKMLADGKNVFIHVNRWEEVRRISVRHYEEGDYCITSGDLHVWLTDVYMIAQNTSVRLIGECDNTRPISTTFLTNEITLKPFERN